MGVLQQYERAAMANANLAEVIGQVKNVVGRSTATAFITPGNEDRFFLVETLFVGAALFLLNRYFSGFFKPVEELGQRNRQMAIELFKRLSNGAIPERVSDESQHLIDSTLEDARTLDSPERRLTAEEEVQRILREYGESAAEASRKASAITEAIFGH